MNAFSHEVHEEDDGRVVVTVRGDVDLAVADRLWDRLSSLIAADRLLVVDCAGVTFLDSMGLSALLRAAQAAVDAGAGRVTLAEPSAPVRRILELSGTGEQFTVTPA